MRITQKHVEAKVEIVNSMLGFDTDNLAVGSIQLYGAYGATAVHRVVNDGGGVDALSGLGTLRETAEFLSGMIAALRLAQERYLRQSEYDWEINEYGYQR